MTIKGKQVSPQYTPSNYGPVAAPEDLTDHLAAIDTALGTPAAPVLSAVLAAGNQTGNNSIDITSTSDFSLAFGAAASGSGLAVTVGAQDSTGGPGGALNLYAGDTTATTSDGGAVTIEAGTGLAIDSSGGAVLITGGIGVSGGGAVEITAGNAVGGAPGTVAGNVEITAGSMTAASGVGQSGEVLITAGNGSANPGRIVLKSGDTDSFSGIDGANIVATTGTATNNNGDGGNFVFTGGQGGTTTGSGGGFIFTGGAGNTGGQISLTGGAGKKAGDPGGNAFFRAGNGNAGGVGGLLQISAGNSPTGNGGALSIAAGGSLGAGLGADVTISPGSSVSGTSGKVVIPAVVGVATTGSLVVDGNASHEVTVTGDLEVTGKLTVGGLIDPTGLVLVNEDPAAVPTLAGQGAFLVADGSGGTTVNAPYYKNGAGVLTPLLAASGGTGWDAVVTNRAELVAQGSISGLNLTITNKRLFVAGDVLMNVGEYVTLSGECVLQGRGAGPASRIRTTENDQPLLLSAAGSLVTIDSLEIASTTLEETAFAVQLRDAGVLENCRIRTRRGVSVFGAGARIQNNLFDTDGVVGPTQTALRTSIELLTGSGAQRLIIQGNRTSLTDDGSLALDYTFIRSAGDMAPRSLVQGNFFQGRNFMAAAALRYSTVDANIMMYATNQSIGGFLVGQSSGANSRFDVDASSVTGNSVQKTNNQNTTSVAFLNDTSLADLTFQAVVFNGSIVVGNAMRNVNINGLFGFFKTNVSANKAYTLTSNRDLVCRANVVYPGNAAQYYYNESTLQA